MLVVVDVPSDVAQWEIEAYFVAIVYKCNGASDDCFRTAMNAYRTMRDP